MDFLEIITMPLKDKYSEWDKRMKNEYDKFANHEKFANFQDIKNNNRQILIN